MTSPLSDLEPRPIWAHFDALRQPAGHVYAQLVGRYREGSTKFLSIRGSHQARRTGGDIVQSSAP